VYKSQNQQYYHHHTPRPVALNGGGAGYPMMKDKG